MEETKPSTTAQRVAVRRGAHQLLDQPPVFVDPLALKILGPEIQATLAKDPRHYETSPIASYLRAFVAVRSRIAEDEVAGALSRGVTQYVLLGAGFDTFAYRNPHASLRVFEVDHPATQTLKRAQLDGVGIAIPTSLTFVPTDFERDTLDAALARAGFNSMAPTVFAWLGVVPYLTRDKIEATWRFIAARPAGSSVVFDYAVDPAMLPIAARMVVAAMAKRVADAGEPFRTYFAPDDLRVTLVAAGFSEVIDLDGREITRDYFGGRTDGLRVGDAGRIVIARV